MYMIGGEGFRLERCTLIIYPCKYTHIDT